MWPFSGSKPKDTFSVEKYRFDYKNVEQPEKPTLSARWVDSPSMSTSITVHGFAVESFAPLTRSLVYYPDDSCQTISTTPDHPSKEGS